MVRHSSRTDIQSGTEESDSERVGVRSLVVTLWNQRDQLVQQIVLGLSRSRVEGYDLVASRRGQLDCRDHQLGDAT